MMDFISKDKDRWSLVLLTVFMLISGVLIVNSFTNKNLYFSLLSILIFAIVILPSWHPKGVRIGFCFYDWSNSRFYRAKNVIIMKVGKVI